MNGAAISPSTIGATEAAVLEEFGGKDAIERLIFMYAILGFGEGKLTVDEFPKRVRALVQRHRGGDLIRPEEIEALAA